MSYRRVTLRDVAQAAQVSINTASRALNEKPDVNEETRERVLEAAARLGYRPNRLAQGLRGKKVGTIGVVVADLSNPFFVEVVKGVEEEAYRHGFTIMVTNTNEDPVKEEEVIKTLVLHQVAGLIITPSQKSDGFLPFLAAEDVPFVLVARRFEQFSCHAVLNDDFTGAFSAVNHLIELGHREILFINGPPTNWSASQRLSGYRQALDRAGIPYRPELVRSCSVTAESGARETLDYLADNPVPDAVFAFSDYMAIGVIGALRERGLNVPGDVSVVGYDGIQIGASLDPPLTTVEIAKHSLGVASTQVLIELIKDEHARHEPRQTMLPPKLLTRQSTQARTPVGARAQSKPTLGPRV